MKLCDWKVFAWPNILYLMIAAKGMSVKLKINNKNSNNNNNNKEKNRENETVYMAFDAR